MIRYCYELKFLKNTSFQVNLLLKTFVNVIVILMYAGSPYLRPKRSIVLALVPRSSALGLLKTPSPSLLRSTMRHLALWNVYQRLGISFYSCPRFRAGYEGVIVSPLRRICAIRYYSCDTWERIITHAEGAYEMYATPL